MAKQDDVNRLATLADCWTFLTVKQGKKDAFTRAEAEYLVTLAHQAFAIGEALQQLQRMEEAREALLRSRPTAGVVAPDSVGIDPIDNLRDATMSIYAPYRAQRDLSEKTPIAPVLLGLKKLGVSPRTRARLANPMVLAAAFVQMGVEHRKLRDVTPLEMEAIVRLCEDRDVEPPGPLEEDDQQQREKKIAAWKRLLWKAQALIPLLRKVTKNDDDK